MTVNVARIAPRYRRALASTGVSFLGKTRLVPFGGDLAARIVEYQQQSDYVASDHNGLWLRRDGTQAPVQILLDTVRGLLRQTGLKPLTGRSGPRPYDFRHNSEKRIIPRIG